MICYSTPTKMSFSRATVKEIRKNPRVPPLQKDKPGGRAPSMGLFVLGNVVIKLPGNIIYFLYYQGRNPPPLTPNQKVQAIQAGLLSCPPPPNFRNPLGGSVKSGTSINS
jgi:hypothetical protein